MLTEQDRAALGPGLTQAIERVHKSLDRAFIAVYTSTAVVVASIIGSTAAIIMATS